MDSSFLKFKKIVLVCPNFYDYHKIIKSNLFHYSNDVKLIFDQKSSLNIQNKILKNTIDAELLIVIKGKNILPETILLAKKKNEYLKTIYYTWDSLYYFDHRKLSIYFDKVFSFENEDCNDSIKHLPLFTRFRFSKDYQPRDIDITFISGFYKHRAEAVNSIKKLLQNYPEKKFYLHLHLPFKIFVKNRLFKYFNSISFKKINQIEYQNVLKRTKFVVDIPDLNQKGATMRSIEAISSGCILLTTNKYIYQNIDLSYHDRILCVAYNELINKVKQIYEEDINYLTFNDSTNKFFISKWLKILIEENL